MSVRVSLIGSALRQLPVGMRGKARLARLLLGRAIDATDTTLQLSDGSRMLIPSVAEPIGFHMLIDGAYEHDELTWLLSHVGPGDVVVDVGANIGGFTIPLARRVGPTGRVIAIEASNRIAQYLRHNVRANALENVTVVETAVSDHADEHTLFYDAPTNRFGSGGLASESGYVQSTVRSATLDEILETSGVSRVAAVKVDVEGFEAHVFRGASRLLQGKSAPLVLFEFYDWAEKRAAEPGEAQSVLRSYGYSIWRFETYSAGGTPLDEVVTGPDGGNLVAQRLLSAC